MTRTIVAADLFAGAGGASVGLHQACEERGLPLSLVAVNHWPTALETHAANFPDARHLQEDLDLASPRRCVPEGKLDVLLAGPSCVHHSRARGGKPSTEQLRATPWAVCRWAEDLRPKVLVVENVPDLLTWGPLDDKGRPIKARKGATFRAWCHALRSLGYRISWRVLCSADFGDATTRERLFIVGVRGKKSWAWPEPTHAPEATAPDLFGRRLEKWRPAREVINWDKPGLSIFMSPEEAKKHRVKRPLTENTLKRIAEGLKRYCPEPFLLPTNYGERQGQTARTHSLAEPMPTLVGTLAHGLVEPILLGQQSGAVGRPVSQPAPTVATSGAIALIEPFLVQYHGAGAQHPVSEPIRTIDTTDRYGLVSGHLADILFRMLDPGELAAAHSFPAGYRFAGKKADVVKQVGNSWTCRLSRALALAALEVAA